VPLDLVSIAAVQAEGLGSPLKGRDVRIRGVVTGSTRKGFFVQDPHETDPEVACALFVYTRRRPPPRDTWVELEGRVDDYVAIPGDRPVTQLRLKNTTERYDAVPALQPVWLDADWLDHSNADLARRLARLQGRLVGIPSGSMFSAPSNLFGDYVVLPPGLVSLRTGQGGMRIDPERPLRWLPGFRLRARGAPRVDVGSKLLDPVIGPLNYRAQSYQIVALQTPKIELVSQSATACQLHSDAQHMSVLTLNGFNLDAQIEDPNLVNDPRRDVDDDVGDGRFEMLARDVVEQAGAPDVIALQEIQDDDGAELTDVVTADATYRVLVDAIARHGGPAYAWVDQPPETDADGGQPGGNIRNGYLYRTDRVEVVPGTVRRLGEGHRAFEDSRKALWAHFRLRTTGKEVAMVNVHLASKRHQHSIFAPESPELDPREPTRVAQAQHIREALLAHEGPVYVTGDFNDHEFSETLRTLCGAQFTNLVESLPPEDRHDYNHRGTGQALMHGVVRTAMAQRGHATYEVLHGNQLVGAEPGVRGTRASDHAYVLALLRLG